ncbi:type 1 fimbrial protein [Pantoea dispersa]|uniref:fimbrial protein n=1 Tax=Pantoea dispersa TaxID=59814 RepID=UPI0021AF1909|nr:fimbrial protein [Pantoea dispersa]MCT6591474.1 type 1 fimbrial protein [Pantoea dispersa]MCW0323199.1 hypothetical protein [Pantoea dispersa]MCW0327935.1 hypothetical protein [Pantoea dispersa]MCW0434360.1 hypothetical protein [Pantoea dispersa]
MRVLLLALTLLSLTLQAATNGVVHVYGALQESPCWLDVGNNDQAAGLDTTPTAALQQVGEQVMRQALTLHLQDCPYSIRNVADPLWLQHVPSISIDFFAPQSLADPQLIRVQGSDGVGLQLFDENHQPLPPTFRNLRVPLSAGSNVLSWLTVEERTALPLQPGAWSASGQLQVNYD